MYTYTVGFQTSCYEKTLESVLKNRKYEEYLSLFSKDTFSEKRILINNIDSKQEAIETIKEIIEGGEQSIEFCFTDATKEEVLGKFNLSLSDFPIGLYYSIQHYTGIYNSNCDYLFHVSEDCDISGLDSRFIDECIDMLESDNRLIVALPRWTEGENAIEQVRPQTEKFYFQFGFTDQIYIIKTKVFRQDIYHFSHPASDRYPSYGGNCFEKRIDSFMRCNNYHGVVHKDYEYKHLS